MNVALQLLNKRTRWAFISILKAEYTTPPAPLLEAYGFLAEQIKYIDIQSSLRTNQDFSSVWPGL